MARKKKTVNCDSTHYEPFTNQSTDNAENGLKLRFNLKKLSEEHKTSVSPTPVSSQPNKGICTRSMTRRRNAIIPSEDGCCPKTFASTSKPSLGCSSKVSLKLHLPSLVQKEKTGTGSLPLLQNYDAQASSKQRVCLKIGLENSSLKVQVPKLGVINKSGASKCNDRTLSNYFSTKKSSSTSKKRNKYKLVVVPTKSVGSNYQNELRAHHVAHGNECKCTTWVHIDRFIWMHVRVDVFARCYLCD